MAGRRSPRLCSGRWGEISYYNTFFKTTHPPAVELAALIAEVTPEGFNRVFFCGSGSEANDTILRMVRTYWTTLGKPGKQVIVARRNAYHGSTVAGASLGGMTPMHAQGGLPIPGIQHIGQPYWFDHGGDLTPRRVRPQGGARTRNGNRRDR